jgi:hypothetical protein
VFGGYQSEKKATGQTYLFEVKDGNQYEINAVNSKSLQFCAPFWDKQVIVHDGAIYALQNVVTVFNSKSSYSTTRRILKFDGKTWKNLS